MPELGAVIGGVLAEFVRARAIADKLTADLVEQYEADPVLSSLNVPRVTFGQADVTVRYVIDGVDIPGKKRPDFKELRAKLAASIPKAVIVELHRNARDDSDLEEPVKAIAAGIKPPSLGSLGKAYDGEPHGIVEALVSHAVEVYSGLSAGTRKKIGTKTHVTQLVERVVTNELKSALAEARRSTDIESILASKIIVSVISDELPDDPARLQEITLTVRAEDLDLIDTSES